MNFELFKLWLANDPHALSSVFHIWLDHLQEKRALSSSDIEIALRENLGEYQ